MTVFQGFGQQVVVSRLFGNDDQTGGFLVQTINKMLWFAGFFEVFGHARSLIVNAETLGFKQNQKKFIFLKYVYHARIVA